MFLTGVQVQLDKVQPEITCALSTNSPVTPSQQSSTEIQPQEAQPEPCMTSTLPLTTHHQESDMEVAANSQEPLANSQETVVNSQETVVNSQEGSVYVPQEEDMDMENKMYALTSHLFIYNCVCLIIEYYHCKIFQYQHKSTLQFRKFTISFLTIPMV